tara:strand:+ start:1542 stop:2702 length:1161 start_codon:yes stop_codon:yes gene_type:complete
MRVLYIHHNSATGGASNSLIILIRELKKKGIDVHVATPNGPVINKFRSVTNNIHIIDTPSQIQAVYGVSFPILRSLISTIFSNTNKQLKKIINEIKPDLVHLNEVGLITTAKCVKQMGIKVVMHVRVAVNPSFRIIYNLSTNYINKYVDHIICIDESASSSLNVKVKKTIVYNPLITINKKTNTIGDNETFTILFLSNFLVHKGIYDLINVAEELNNFNNIKFLIAGSNVKSNNFYDSFLGKFLVFFRLYPNIDKDVRNIKNNKNLKNIVFLGQIKNIKEQINKADLLLLPIHMNQPSRSIFEAGSHGVPSIISLKTKVEDVVQDGVNGYIVQEKKPSEISNAILKLNNDRSLLKKMGLNSFNKFNDLNSPIRSATDVINVYKILI